MLRGLVSFRLPCALALIACSTPDPHHLRVSARLEIEIARGLTARFAVAVTTQCSFIAGMPFDCKGVFPDRTALPIAVNRARPGPGWDWRIEGQVVETGPVAAHVAGMLTDLGVAQTVTCGPMIRRIEPGERIACKLSGGGVAFVDVAGDGTTAYELAIEPAAAGARGEQITVLRDRELSSTSTSLAHLAADPGENDEGPPDIIDGGTQPDSPLHSRVAP